MGELFLFIVVALTVAAIVFAVTVLVGGGDPGLTPVEPDGRALPLPGDRPLAEEDVVHARFDTAVRGYRMAQVDQALQRAAYDIGYKGELIGVLEAEVAALREGRTADADVLRRAREAAVQPAVAVAPVQPAVAAVQIPPVDAGSTDVADTEVSGAEISGAHVPADDVPAVDDDHAAAAADDDEAVAGKGDRDEAVAGKGDRDEADAGGSGAPAASAGAAMNGATDGGTTAESR